MSHRRVLQRDAVGTEDGAALPRNGDRLTCVVELAEADLARLEPSGILEPTKMQRKQEALCSSRVMSASFCWVSW